MKQIIGVLDINVVNRNIPMATIDKFVKTLGIKYIGFKRKDLNWLLFYKEVK